MYFRNLSCKCQLLNNVICGDCSCKSGDYCSNDVCLLNVSGNTYFVATNGNDNNPGTFEQPFLSWGKAFRTAQAGDISLFQRRNLL